MLKNKSGITLIALIITIIVLLILAGITISLVVGDNGILNKATSSKELSVIGREKETISISWDALITKKLASNEEITDETFEQELINNGNDVTVSYDADENYLVHFNDTGHEYIVNGNGDIDSSEESMLAPTETSVTDDTVKFSTEYGRIDVIWLSGTSNTAASLPNEPNLSGMTPVSWTLNENTWTEDVTASESYYSYIAGSGTEDNASSRWANAKNSDGSYFVWIPRYAYRITYYDNETSTEPTGYCDGYGQWRASDGKMKMTLDNGIKTVNYGGKKYIIHPAFCGESVGYDNGSWNEDITGFWVAKYEMSREGATTSSAGSGYDTIFLSVPSVQCAKNITIGNAYNVARNYDSSKESHLIKNSEWGAVVYLAHSQYGRNGSKISPNGDSNHITGSGASGGVNNQNYRYNTINGIKASTTGNVYGVYDMSGGANDYVAAFNNTYTDNYETSNGSSFASATASSNKYVTKYYNETTSANGDTIIYACGKIGDATKEVLKGGGNVIYANGSWNWFEENARICNTINPFICRGYSGIGGGYFKSYESIGDSASNASFRVVLCP